MRLTILLNNMLARRNKLREALKLVPGHRPVSSALQRQIGLKVRVQVLLQCDVAYEAHAAQGAVKLDSREDLALSCFRWSTKLIEFDYER